ncbi:hypothetical protein PT974_07380 [Cladobotryum mycophilum]|uniref:C2H2-type domain-containing protein n=1 Tax=Cladobotryum mycophilum TaxID=491253 RepID=A0ABR0SP43_9HYPO
MDYQPPDNQQWLCKPCHLLFSSREKLMKHKASQRAENNGGHIHCNHCGMDFHTELAELKHIQREHAESQNLHCPGCGHGPFKRVGGLIAHIESGECLRISGDMVDELREAKLEFPRRLEQLTKQPLKNNFAQYMPYHNSLAGEPELEFVVEPTAHKPAIKLTTEEFPSLSDAAGKGPKTTRHPTTSPTSSSETDSANNNGKPAPPGWSLRVSHDGNTSGVKVGCEWLDPDHPDCPSFNSARYYCSIAERWNCPRTRCLKTFKTAKALVGHLRGPAHGDKTYRCPHCFKEFKSLTAITQHAESNGNRCRIRDTENYNAYLDQLTGGIIDVQPSRHADGTVAYRTSDKAKELFNGKGDYKDKMSEVGMNTFVQPQPKPEPEIFW